MAQKRTQSEPARRRRLAGGLVALAIFAGSGLVDPSSTSAATIRLYRETLTCSRGVVHTTAPIVQAMQKPLSPSGYHVMWQARVERLIGTQWHTINYTNWYGAHATTNTGPYMSTGWGIAGPRWYGMGMFNWGDPAMGPFAGARFSVAPGYIYRVVNTVYDGSYSPLTLAVTSGGYQSCWA